MKKKNEIKLNKNECISKINNSKENKDERKVFTKFIETKITNSDHYTFGSINPPRKYLVENSDIETFWEKYCNAIYYDNMSSFTITEKPETYMAVLGDIDVRIDTGNEDFKKRFPNFKIENFRYSELHLQKIVRIYQTVLKTIISTKDSKVDLNDNLIACVLEKTKIKFENGIIKFGIHIHFPYSFINANDKMTDLFLL